MKKKKYREIYHKQNIKKEKPTVIVEKKKENIEKNKKTFNVFFDLKDEQKKSSDE